MRATSQDEYCLRQTGFPVFRNKHQNETPGISPERPNQSAGKTDGTSPQRLGAPLGEWQGSLREPDKKLGAMHLSGYNLDTQLQCNFMVSVPLPVFG
jgi:hypothetical protein